MLASRSVRRADAGSMTTVAGAPARTPTMSILPVPANVAKNRIDVASVNPPRLSRTGQIERTRRGVTGVIESDEYVKVKARSSSLALPNRT